MTGSQWDELKVLPFSEFLRWDLAKLRTGQIDQKMYRALIKKYCQERENWANEMINYAKEIGI